MIAGAAAPSKPPRPRLRLRLSRDGHEEMRALSRSALAHGLILLAIVGVDWLRRVPFTQPKVVRVGLVPAMSLPTPARPAQAPRPSAPRPQPTAVPESPPPPEPEPEPEPRPEPPDDLPGIAPPAPTPPPKRPRPETQEPAPRPTATPAPASPSPVPATPSATVGIQAAVEGWEGGPGDPYLDGIVRRVSGKWLKPRTGLPARSATVWFVISRGGEVSGIRLETPSGSALFDRAALRAVELASPLPPLPASVSSPSLKVHFDFLP